MIYGDVLKSRNRLWLISGAYAQGGTISNSILLTMPVTLTMPASLLLGSHHAPHDVKEKNQKCAWKRKWSQNV